MSTPINDLQIQDLDQIDIHQLITFCDREIGQGYYTVSELKDMIERSTINEVCCSLALVNRSGQVMGLRLSFPPGRWSHGKGERLSTELWPFPMEKTGYFQSLFLTSSVQGQGWGSQMSRLAMERLKLAGSSGIACHSWKESPGNSSQKYLLKLGFVAIVEYPEYWREVDYNCTRCLKPPCLCTAVEMYKTLED